MASPPEDKSNVSPIEVEYKLSKDSAIQIIKNSPAQYWQSINPKLTLLKTPITVVNHWDDIIEINKVNYVCKSYIRDVFLHKDGKSCVTVESTINNLPGYSNETYKETHTFKEGVGLYSFENIVLLGNSEDNSNKNSSEEKKTNKPLAFDFNYHLVETP